MHHYTINGCYRTDIKVIPQNWKKKKQLKPKEKWLIYYRFYDPQFKEDPEKWAFLVRIKGMNDVYSIDERKRITQDLIDQEIDLLDRRMWNPVTNQFMKQTPVEKTTSFALKDALWWGFEKLTCIQQTKNDIKSVINGFLTAAHDLFDPELMLPFDQIPVRQFTRSKVYHTLDKCAELNKRFTNNRQNVYKAYLSSVYRILMRYEIVEHNVMKDIEKRKTIKKQRAILTLEQEQLVNDHLLAKNYEFWRFMQIFFYADARETELMKLRKDGTINLKEQEFQVTMLKGTRPEEAIKQISNEVVHLGKEILDEAKEGEYLFSKGLKPGPAAIRPDQINRRWYKLVKRPKDKGGLNIQIDFRSLNHSHLTKVSASLGIAAAAESRNHKTPVVTMDHYDIGYKKRIRNNVKNSGVKLGS